ncbi:hypothetical protein MIND_00315500 [Mycena indigotica]|uniref:Uncharacterized protein n=1 Tax=Mycena indigotica TaxID=2126181 RepID=A0A8H6T3X1_9AGAR|nr:uncharacterized protein MIND_00315500 [Mycena indigotica]KAF7309447.1 hypothetical protein MIND_00315500 [Mycena indigotica]
MFKFSSLLSLVLLVGFVNALGPFPKPVTVTVTVSAPCSPPSLPASPISAAFSAASSLAGGSLAEPKRLAIPSSRSSRSSRTPSSSSIAASASVSAPGVSFDVNLALAPLQQITAGWYSQIKTYSAALQKAFGETPGSKQWKKDISSAVAQLAPRLNHISNQVTRTTNSLTSNAKDITSADQVTIYAALTTFAQQVGAVADELNDAVVKTTHPGAQLKPLHEAIEPLRTRLITLLATVEGYPVTPAQLQALQTAWAQVTNSLAISLMSTASAQAKVHV